MGHLSHTHVPSRLHCVKEALPPPSDKAIALDKLITLLLLSGYQSAQTAAIGFNWPLTSSPGECVLLGDQDLYRAQSCGDGRQ